MLWTITSYFNPVGYANRLRNYRVFRANLASPLAVVELSIDGKFELSRNDAEIVVQITGGDVLWQKERLLNVALRHLPDECNHVAWVDCDVIFLEMDWAQRADQALEKSCLIQPFRERWNLARDAAIASEVDVACDSISKSVGYKIVVGEAQAEDFGQSSATSRRVCAGVLRIPKGRRLRRRGSAASPSLSQAQNSRVPAEVSGRSNPHPSQRARRMRHRQIARTRRQDALPRNSRRSPAPPLVAEFRFQRECRAECVAILCFLCVTPHSIRHVVSSRTEIFGVRRGR
jgi:hypothetical protein